MPSPSSHRKAQSSAPACWAVGEGRPPAGPFVALVPGTAAPLLAVSLPATLRGTARLEVARRQILDRLGARPGALDIRPALLGGTAPFSRVVVAARREVQGWRAALGADAARCRALLPDYAVLPTAPGLWTLTLAQGLVRARLGPDDGFSAEPELAARMLTRALAAGRPRALLWLADAPAPDELLAAIGEVPLFRAPQALPEDLRPAVLGHGELSLDLSRDPEASAESLARLLRRALWPALLILLGAVGWSGAQILAARADLDAAARLRAEVEAAARRDLLGDAPIVDLRLQVARALDQRRTGAALPDTAPSALERLRRAAEAMSGSAARVQAVTLDEGQGALRLEVQAPDFRALEQAQADLAEAGLHAELESSATDPQGGVSARLLITGGAP